MSAKWQRITIALPAGYNAAERAAIGIEAIDRIVDRTRKDNVDKNGRPFKDYSDSYIKSKAFRIGGKSESRVDITLSGETLDSLKVLSSKPGSVTIGFEKGSDANAKADGNIRGTYGSSTPNQKKARDFLGLTLEEKKKILANYPMDDDEARQERVEATEVEADGSQD